jgi:XTP/dITP diphosphohydrolase
VADDSGLEVDALNGAPGVYSARYGEKETDEERIRHLLENLKGVSSEDRTGRFVCCATLFGEGKLLFQTTDTVEGKILDEERGEGGFGYDPLFLPDGFCITTAEMTPAQKHRISHRGKAMSKVKEFLEGLQSND